MIEIYLNRKLGEKYLVTSVGWNVLLEDHRVENTEIQNDNFKEEQDRKTRRSHAHTCEKRFPQASTGHDELERLGFHRQHFRGEQRCSQVHRQQVRLSAQDSSRLPRISLSWVRSYSANSSFIHQKDWKAWHYAIILNSNRFWWSYCSDIVT